ncbi:MAG: iron ABC transporter permease [Oligoflexia bacterium]|nr:iron ABC transporter permease [Oligoflexia bacterium]
MTDSTGKTTNTINVKLLVLFFLAISAFLFSLHRGHVEISFNEIMAWLTKQNMSDESAFLISTLRFPRTLAAFIIGATLGVCGLVFQTLLRNPLAEPYTLGLSGGSCLGAVAALTFSLEPPEFWIPTLSTVGCLSATLLVLGLGRKKLSFESRSLILFGVMISLFFSAAVVAGLSILSPQKLQTALFWLLGEFGTSRDIWIKSIGPVLVAGMLIILFKSRGLDALSLGEARALSLGFSPRKERVVLILICTLLTALSVCISGLVGFVGLVSPHLARKFLKTSRHHTLVIGSAFTGAILLTLADSIARSALMTTEIPAGSISALIGAPVMIFLLLGYKNASVE